MPSTTTFPGSCPPARRLLIRPGAIGDFIVSLPALEFLRTSFTEIWASETNLPLARSFDRAYSITSTGLDLLGLAGIDPPARLVERLRSFDSIVSWYGSSRIEFREAVDRLGLPFQFFAALPGAGMHACDFYLAQAGAPTGGFPRISCDAARGGHAVIHPFTSSVRKRWPLERFREVARRLPMPVVWCAGPEEPLDGAVRLNDLYELARWLASARVFIGNDTGISHLAAAVGTPVIALFGPTDPSVWAPRGPRVRVLAPLEAVTPDQVLAAVEWINHESPCEL